MNSIGNLLIRAAAFGEAFLRTRLRKATFVYVRQLIVGKRTHTLVPARIVQASRIAIAEALATLDETIKYAYSIDHAMLFDATVGTKVIRQALTVLTVRPAPQ